MHDASIGLDRNEYITIYDYDNKSKVFVCKGSGDDDSFIVAVSVNDIISEKEVLSIEIKDGKIIKIEQ